MKLEKIQILNGKIKLITGLHIGGGNEAIEIGGIDNPIIKDPKTKYPIIPGSSIKGKMRSLLEQKLDKIKDSGKPCSCGNCEICRLFGNTSKESKVGPTRAIFRDAFLSKESIKETHNKNLLPTEAKMENTINRLKGTAEHPRQSERAIAGLVFDFEIAIRVFEGDGNKSLELLKEGLSLVQKDALGGSGSRGYGKIEFCEMKLDNAEFTI